MPDVYDPISTQMSNKSAIEMLNDFKTDLLARTTLQLRLYKNNVTLGPDKTIADLVEADFGGYAPLTIASFAGAYLDAQNNAYIVSPLLTFTADGTTGNTIYGAAVVATPLGATPATATDTGALGVYDDLVVITAGGSGYQAPPKVNFTGATGSGAEGFATIVNGVVTNIEVTNGGTGYTTFTITIDPPIELIELEQLSVTGISMALATDALPTLAQITQPSVAIQNP